MGTDLNKSIEQIAGEYAVSIVETVRDPLIVLDADLRIISANKSFYSIFKVNPEETQGQLIYDLGDRQWDIPALRKLLEEILPNNTSFENYEVEHDFPGIGKRIMILNARRIPQPPAKPRIILLAIEDVTERKRLENELLLAEEEEFKVIFNSAADGILIADLESKKFRDGNSAICRMLGYSEEEIKNLGIMDIHPQKDLQYITDQFERQAKGEFSMSSDMPVKRKDGSVFYADVNAIVIKIVGKAYLMGSFHDTTERKKKDEALHESEEKFNNVIESSQDCIKILDKTGGLLLINKAGLGEHGFKTVKEALDNWDYLNTIEEEYVPKIKEALSQVSKGAIISFDIKHKQGENITGRANREWCNMTFSPLKSKQGEILNILAVSRNISDRIKTEEELRRKAEELKRMNEIMTGRELRVIELKKENEELKKRLGEA